MIFAIDCTKKQYILTGKNAIIFISDQNKQGGNDMKKKIMTMAIAAVLLCSAGCAGENDKEASSNFDGEINFPIDESVTLTIWRDNSLFVVDNYKEMGCYKGMEEATGIAVDFIHPVAGQSSEQFNTLSFKECRTYGFGNPKMKKS